MPQENRLLSVNGYGTYPDTLRKRLKAGQAVHVIHQAIAGEPVTRIQLDACRILLNKVLPDLQAVALDVSSDKPETMQDVSAQLLLAGINPDDAWKLLQSQSNIIEGNSEAVPDSSEDPPTPESESCD